MFFAVGDLTKTAMDGVGFMRSEHQPAKDKMPYIQFITAVAVPGLDHTMTGLIKEVNDAGELILNIFLFTSRQSCSHMHMMVLTTGNTAQSQFSNYFHRSF